MLPTFFKKTRRHGKSVACKKSRTSDITHQTPVTATIPERFTTSSHIGQLQIKVADLADIWRGPTANDTKQEG